MSKKVILSALQSGKAGVFSDQLLTRLMVIFFSTGTVFTVKFSSLHACFIYVPFLLSLYLPLFSSSSLHVTAVPAAPHHLFFHANAVLFLPHYPPHAATKCSCFELIQIQRHIFQGTFPSFCLRVHHHTRIQTVHAQRKSHPQDQFNSFIRILQQFANTSMAISASRYTEVTGFKDVLLVYVEGCLLYVC